MSPLKIAFFTTFIDLLGFGIIIPIQPFYAKSFGVSATIVTLLGASYSLMQFLFSSSIGRLSDRVGRRPVLLGCVSLIVVGYVLFGLAESVTMLFIARMISGLGGANLGATQAIIADVTSPEERSKGMGLIGAAFGLGFILGPALGGALGQHHATTPIFAAAGLAALNLLFIWRFLPETCAQAKATKEGELSKESVSAEPHPPHTPRLKRLAPLLASPNVRPLLGLALTFTLAFALMEQTIGLFIERVWVEGRGLSPAEQSQEASALTAYFLVLIGVAATIVQGGLIGKLTRRFGEARLAKVGVFFVLVSVAVIPLAGRAESFITLLAVALLMATGTGVLHPSRSSLISQSVPAELQGQALGLNQSLAALGRVLGPAIAGYLFEQHHERPLWCAVGVLSLTLLLAQGIKQPSTPSTSPLSGDELSLDEPSEVTSVAP